MPTPSCFQHLHPHWKRSLGGLLLAVALCRMSAAEAQTRSGVLTDGPRDRATPDTSAKPAPSAPDPEEEALRKKIARQRQEMIRRGELDPKSKVPLFSDKNGIIGYREKPQEPTRTIAEQGEDYARFASSAMDAYGNFALIAHDETKAAEWKNRIEEGLRKQPDDLLRAIADGYRHWAAIEREYAVTSVSGRYDACAKAYDFFAARAESILDERGPAPANTADDAGYSHGKPGNGVQKARGPSSPEVALPYEAPKELNFPRKGSQLPLLPNPFTATPDSERRDVSGNGSKADGATALPNPFAQQANPFPGGGPPPPFDVQLPSFPQVSPEIREHLREAGDELFGEFKDHVLSGKLPSDFTLTDAEKNIAKNGLIDLVIGRQINSLPEDARDLFKTPYDVFFNPKTSMAVPFSLRLDRAVELYKEQVEKQFDEEWRKLFETSDK